MFHSMVRGSSPAWYSRTSVYSRPAPRNEDRSSPPGWNPSRRSTGQRDRRISSSIRTVPVMASGGNPVSKIDARRREAVEHAANHSLGGDAGRDSLVGENQPVTDHLGGDFTEVVRQHVGAAAHEGQRPAGSDQVDGRARAGAVGNRWGKILEPLHLARAAGIGQGGGIGTDRRVDVDL